jgi:hypothetical protein
LDRLQVLVGAVVECSERADVEIARAVVFEG